ncbi:MAG: dGTPase [Spirochaetae bacterium HGW-Spirochaetae-8]|jgi:dGTPase|nr:MAG: dGTPase [Spirochaetae bacterium HGW-Spirochaetae-8]
MNSDIYKEIIICNRFSKSSNPSRKIHEQALSDKARIVYSSAFRRLQSKTQVFALSPNAAIRSRLTHSIEVASVGRWIAEKVMDSCDELEYELKSTIPILVETGCLAHDIGNPPFGHFGEDAIKKWFQDNGDNILTRSIGTPLAKKPETLLLLKDFYEFDGNPQGIRILTRLQGLTKSDRINKGMNLMCSQILTCLKYPQNPSDSKNHWKKPGYFLSEVDRIEFCWKVIPNYKSLKRFPLAYIVEAADDISYCLSDLEDGIDERLITAFNIFTALNGWSETKSSSESMKELRKTIREIQNKNGSENARDQYLLFKTKCTNALIERAAEIYISKHEQLLSGDIKSLFEEDSDEDRLLKTLKKLASIWIYPSNSVELTFLSGERIIQGILDAYRPILELQKENFDLLCEAAATGDRTRIKSQNCGMMLPIFNRLPQAYVEVYKAHLEKNSTYDKNIWEWFCRAHLVVDFISGMADNYAMHFYEILSGRKASYD